MESKVFIPQIVTRFDHVSGKKIPAFDFSAAAQFGQLEAILDENDDTLFLARITQKIRKSLEGYSENDFLLAVGDPSVIAVCAGIIFRRRTKMKMLKWDRKMQTYLCLELNP